MWTSSCFVLFIVYEAVVEAEVLQRSSGSGWVL